MTLPPLVVERPSETKRSGPMDDAMIQLVEHVMEKDCRHKMSLLHWPDLDNKAVTKSFMKLMEEELYYTMPEVDANILVHQFRQRYHFDFKSFISAFDAYYDYHYKANKLPHIMSMRTCDSSCSSSYISLSPRSIDSKSSASQNWNVARSKSKLSSLTHALSVAVEDRTLHRAISQLEEELTRRIINKVPDAKLLLGNLTIKNFRSEMKSALDVDLSALGAAALFTALDKNGDGVISTREFMSYVNETMVKLRRRLKDADIHRRKDGTRAAAVFARPAFNRALVLLIQAATDRNLSLPHELLEQSDIRRMIRDQLEVSLSEFQLQCLCHMISKTNKQMTKNKREFLRSYSTEASHVEDEEAMSAGPMQGQLLNCFYVQLRKYMG